MRPLIAGLLLAAAQIPIAAAVEPGTRTLLVREIASAPLHEAVRSLSTSAPWTVIYESPEIFNVRTRRVRDAGDMTDALMQMLTGTGLRFQVDDANRIIFIRTPRKQALTSEG